MSALVSILVVLVALGAVAWWVSISPVRIAATVAATVAIAVASHPHLVYAAGLLGATVVATIGVAVIAHEFRSVARPRLTATGGVA